MWANSGWLPWGLNSVEVAFKLTLFQAGHFVNFWPELSTFIIQASDGSLWLINEQQSQLFEKDFMVYCSHADSNCGNF